METALTTDERFEETRHVESSLDSQEVIAAIQAKASAATSSADLADLVAELEEELGKAERREADAVLSLQGAAFEGRDLDAVQAEVAAIGPYIVTLRAILAGAKARHEQALLREFDRSSEELGAENKADEERYAEVLPRLVETVESLRVLCAEIDQIRTRVSGRNGTLENRGRADLRVWLSKEREPPKPRPAGLSKNGKGIDDLLRNLASPNPRRIRMDKRENPFGVDRAPPPEPSPAWAAGQDWRKPVTALSRGGSDPLRQYR